MDTFLKAAVAKTFLGGMSPTERELLK